MRSISDVFTDFQHQLDHETITVGDLLDVLHERGFGFLLLIFATPMALPIPVPPGINILLASPLVLLTAQQALGRHTIWMPKSIKSKSITRSKMDGMLKAIIPWMRRIEVLSKPRMGAITQGLFSNLIGLMGLMMALTVMIPVPLTNTIPSLGIALMAVGVIMRDGLAVLSGAVIGMCWLAILAFAVIFFGAEGLDIVKEFIKSFL